ncbi:hypothetical protein RRF57_003296 [Xylaria bambusicola]|uniref:Uncharacterized protein n=1 Tax=Xylaria bambusicola TaxID=326684 RepID=A0AAN7ULK4_9PEZI
MGVYCVELLFSVISLCIQGLCAAELMHFVLGQAVETYKLIVVVWSGTPDTEVQHDFGRFGSVSKVGVQPMCSIGRVTTHPNRAEPERVDV